jgi:hypothetical protein
MATTSKYFRPISTMTKKRKHVKIEAAAVGEPRHEAVKAKINNAPDNWDTVYTNILEMRKDKTAPVDTMGCEKIQEMTSDPKVSKSLQQSFTAAASTFLKQRI